MIGEIVTILWIVFAALNFLLAAGYLVRKGLRRDYPFWMYAAAALLCWWPVTLYPLLFHVEAARETDPARKCTDRLKIRLGWLVWAATVLVQGILSLAFRSAMGADADPAFAAFGGVVATFFLSVVLLAAVGSLERRSE